jgi:hypothetical protein
MPIVLKSVVDSLESVPEAYRAKYKEDETTKKFHLQEIEIPDVPDVAGLKANSDKLLGEKKRLQEQLDALKDVDPEEYRRLKAEAAQRDTEQLKSEGKFDELLEKWRKEKEDSENQWKAKLEAKDAELNKILVDDQLRKYATEGGIVKELIDDVVELHRSRVRKTEKGSLVVLDDSGEPLDVSLPKYFSDYYKEKKPHYYVATGAGGSGASASQNGGARGARTIQASDQDALNSNIADIAAGKVVVNPA